MTNSTSHFYSDSEFVRREREPEYSAICKSATLQDENARRHCKEGFLRRHGMIETSRMHLKTIVEEGRTRPLAPFGATEAAIHLNAYYLNFRGAFDNLAWCLQYEWKVLDALNELSATRQDCGLWGKRFSAALHLKNAPLATALGSHAAWGRELANFRDPAAHRIPLLILWSKTSSQNMSASGARLSSPRVTAAYPAAVARTEKGPPAALQPSRAKPRESQVASPQTHRALLPIT
jgi:hypothetical protein